MARSTTEAEYIAAADAGAETIFLRNLFSELGQDVSKPFPLYIDNLSAVQVAKNPEHHGRLKHLDLKYLWLRDEVASGKISIHHCPTTIMPADLLTKPLALSKVQNCCKLMGVFKLQELQH